MKNTKRSMLVSGLCLLLTAVMLMGSTFAWFTDSVTNEGNVITAGNLSIDAFAYDLDEGGEEVTIPGVNGGNAFTFEKDGQNLKTDTTPILDGEIDWEPGKSNAKLLTVTNSGSLAANIRLSFDVTDGGLEDALWFDFVRVDENGDVQGQFEKRPMSTLNQLAQSMVMPLKAGETLRFVLVYGMYESADNQFQAKTFSADVTIMATQAPVEEDGFGNPNYDAAADGTPDQDWALGGTTVVTKPTTGWAEETTLAVPGVTAVVPNTAIAEGENELELQVIQNQEQAEGVSVPVSTSQEAYYLDISVNGLSQDNTTEIPVTLTLDKNLTGVQVYHNSDPMAEGKFTYDAATGELVIYSASFSPFTVVYDKAWTGEVDAEGLEANTDSSAKTVTIDSEAQLAAFAQKVNSGTTYTGYTITLNKNLDLRGVEWSPIGGYQKPFSGIFDGRGHTISNLKITKGMTTYAENCCLGLFGYAGKTAQIKNFSLNNVEITGSIYVGAVLGEADPGVTVSNVQVTNVNISASQNVAGIIGYVIWGNGTKVTDCTVSGNITIHSDGWAGGIVGQGNVTIDGCNVVGTIDIFGDWYIGGILGKGYATVTDCHVDGVDAQVSEVSNSGGYSGGIVGYMGEGNCQTNGCTVKNLTVSGTYNGIGGVNGILHYGNTISDCTVEDVVVWVTSNPDDDGRIYVGAFAGTYLDNNGKNPPTLRGCEFTGELYSGTEKTDVLEANRYVGSLWYGAEPPATVNIENCIIHMP